ncbi:hypothetical protein N7486_008407 [Penicillium sp. IBT 16267x]|nr:hypothetical protein N7486_008407 [Penicillium sp. IBT 16267x]
MGRALTKLGELAKARALLLEVISVYSEWWGRRHLETMRAIDELAWVFMEEGKDKQARNGNGDSEMRNAEELWSEALEFYQSSDKDGFDVANRIEANLRYLCSLRQGA